MRRENYWLQLTIAALTRFRSNFLLRHPALLNLLGRLFPGVKAVFVKILQGRVRSREEARLDEEIKGLLRKSSFYKLLNISKAASETPLGQELVRLGFAADRTKGRSDFTFGFYSPPSEIGSMVRVTTSNGEIKYLLNEKAFDKYIVRFFTERLLDFATGYSEGVRKVLKYEEARKGNPDFYLCLDDGAVDDLTAFEEELPIYAFARRIADLNIGLLPDPYILKDLLTLPLPRTYPDKESARIEFEARKVLTFWRGSTTGDAVGNDIYSNPRIAACIEAKNYPSEIDAKISMAFSNFDSSGTRRKLARLDVMADPVNEEDFAKYRHYLDLEGYTAAWGTVRKYLRCIHIFKPTPRFSHYLEFFLDPGSYTPISSLAEIHSSPDDFEIAYRGYQSTLKALELIKSGDATIFPVIPQKR